MSASSTMNQQSNPNNYDRFQDVSKRRTFIFASYHYTEATVSSFKIGNEVIWMLPNHLWSASNPYIGRVEFIASRETVNGKPNFCAIVEFYQNTSSLLNYLGPEGRNRNFIPLDELMLLEAWKKTLVDTTRIDPPLKHSNAPMAYGWATPQGNQEGEDTRSKRGLNLSLKHTVSDETVRTLHAKKFERDNIICKTLPLLTSCSYSATDSKSQESVEQLAIGSTSPKKAVTASCSTTMNGNGASLEIIGAKDLSSPPNTKNEFDMYTPMPLGESPFKIGDKVVWMIPSRESGCAFVGEVLFVGYETDNLPEKNIIAVVRFHQSTSHLPGYISASPPNRNTVNVSHLILLRQFEELVKMKLLDFPTLPVEQEKEVELIGNCIAVHGGVDAVEVDGIQSGDLIKLATKITAPPKQIFGDIMMTCKLKGFRDTTFVGVKFHKTFLKLDLPISFRHYQNENKEKCKQCEGGKLVFVRLNYLTNGTPVELREKISFTVYGKKTF